MTAVFVRILIALAVLQMYGLPAHAQTFAANPETLGGIFDGGSACAPSPGVPRNVTFTVAGLSGPVESVQLSINLTHPFVGDLVAQLIAPNNLTFDVFGRTGAKSLSAFGDSSDLLGTYTFSDSATANWWSTAEATGASTAIPPGSYRTSQLGGAGSTGAVTSMNGRFAGVSPNGVWTLRLTDGCSGDVGSVGAGTALTLSVDNTPQPPSGLNVAAVAGQLVTLRWTPPAFGPTLTGYVVEGGVAPGEVLASIPTNSVQPALTFVAPAGSFSVRVHALTTAGRSPASNEVPLFVNASVPPSAPANLQAMVNGSAVTFAWKNTFGGGVPQAVILDVSGSASASIPFGATDAVTFDGAPGGVYTVSARAANAGGVSGSSNAVSVSVPGPCSGAPQTPANFLAYRAGNVIYVTWDLAASGPAPSQFLLTVGGSFVGDIPLITRGTSSPVAPGVYQLSVRAVNACGASAATAVQTILVP